MKEKKLREKIFNWFSIIVFTLLGLLIFSSVMMLVLDPWIEYPGDTLIKDFCLEKGYDDYTNSIISSTCSKVEGDKLIVRKIIAHNGGYLFYED